MPFPDGSGTSGDPFVGHNYYGGQGAVATGTAGAPTEAPDGWLAGLAPPSADVAGLPDYLVNPSHYVPPPDPRAPEQPQPAPAPPIQSFEPPELQLSPSLDTKIKCTRCGKMNAPDATKCVQCGKSLAAEQQARRARVNASAVEEPARSVVLFGTGLPLSLSAAPGKNGLFWKVACKTGMLALSPGPGQTDLDVPLELTPDLFDSMLEAYEKKAFPYVTVPETHANGALENTGYVKALEKLSKEQLLADSRITQAGKDVIQGDPEDTEYLLAGINFTDPKAKEKADNGSIPDTSVGVKFGYRYKRTGEKFKAALEHLALTPIPWVDGLIPFNAEAALTAQEPQDDAIFDGVFTEVNLATDVRTRGDFDPTAARAALMNLQPGDEWCWEYEVRVQRLNTPNGDAAQGDGPYFLLNAPGGKGDEYSSQPTLYSDLESLMSAVSDGVARCQQRRAADKARMDAIRAQVGPVESAAGYSAQADDTWDPGDDLELYLAGPPAAVREKLASKNQALDDGSYPIRNISDLKKAIQAFGRAGDKGKVMTWIKRRAKALGAENLLPDSWKTANASVQDVERGLSGSDQLDSLSLSDPGATHAMPDENEITLESILAQQQALIERLEARLEERDTQLSAANQQIGTLSDSDHDAKVLKKLRRLEGTLPPSVLMAAAQVYRADRPSRQPDENGGLNLSVQATVNGTETEHKLGTPSEIVDFMLSAIPAGTEEQANAATVLAAVNEGLDSFHLSAHDEANGSPAAREQLARESVMAWRREHGLPVAESAAA
jgi:hypothetical protein